MICTQTWARGTCTQAELPPAKSQYARQMPVWPKTNPAQCSDLAGPIAKHAVAWVHAESSLFEPVATAQYAAGVAAEES